MQNDFVVCDKFSKILQEDIEKTFNKGYNDISNEVVMSSNITRCDRRICYELIGVETSGNKFKELHKTYLIKKWVDILLRTKTFEIINSNTIVADHNYNIISEIDVIGKFSGVPVVIMIKEVEENTFLNNSTKRSHVVEIMVQMWLSEINDGFLIYENILTKRHNVFHILPNVSVLNAVKQKMIILRDCKIMGKLPERKYETPDSNECKECCFTDECWRKKGNG